MDTEGSGPHLSKLDLPVASLEMLSHELRTPLTPLLGYLDALLAEDADQLSDTQRHHLEIVRRNAKRLARVAAETFLAKEDADETAAGPF